MRGVVFIKIPGGITGFAEDKDEARKLRLGLLIPALGREDFVTLDFKYAAFSTQSFIHALIGEALNRFGEEVLTNLEFKNCSPQVQGLIELVVDYSLGGFQKTENEAGGSLTPQTQGPRRKSARKSTKKAKK